MKGYLILETGSIYKGTFIIPPEDEGVSAEIVFNTSMTGYQEILTDPSYCGQIITFTYPLIGNYGMYKDFEESNNVYASGLIVNEAFSECDHEAQDIKSYFKDLNIPIFAGIDTRKLVKEIREHGTLRAYLVTDKCIDVSIGTKAMVEYCRSHIKPKVEVGMEVKYTSTKKQYVIQNGISDTHIVLVDYGFKRNMVNCLLKRGCRVTILPYDTDANTILSLKPDGVMLSNGPGDPKDILKDTSYIKRIRGKVPILGICLGHQLLALNLGGDTYKLKYGHRGANHPVQDVKSKKVWITAQNHGYSVSKDHLPEGMEISHINLNDGTVEGLRHLKYPIMSVQFHPEASPGPNDSEEIFDTFLKQVYSFRYSEHRELWY